MRVLVSGGNGAVGGPIVSELIASGHDVVVYDRTANGAHPDATTIVGDVCDQAELAAAASTCDAGIHLAALSGEAEPREILNVNVIGAYNFFHAGLSAGLSGVVLASSIPVDPAPVHSSASYHLRASEARDHVYDLSKLLQETVGRDFHRFGLPVLCLRLGHIVHGGAETNLDDATPLAQLTYARGVWVAIEDVVTAFVAAVAKCGQVEEFETLNIVGSVTARDRFDVACAEQRLGLKFRFGFETV